MEDKNQGKIKVEVKQNPKGGWYVSSLNINADSLDEFDGLFAEASKKLKGHLKNLNENSVKQQEPVEVLLDSDSIKVFQNLKELRRLLAKREGNPPYVIFHDSVLRKLAMDKPRNNKELIDIMGQKKFDKYGGLVIEVLDRHRPIF